MNLKDDFYEYVNYKWLNETKISSNKSFINEFDNLQDINIRKIDDLINNLDKTNNIYKYYKAGIDIVNDKSARINLLKIINLVKSVNDTNSLINCLTILTKLNIPHFFHTCVDIDIKKNNNRHIIYVSEPSVPLPSKEYYTGTSFNNILVEYKNYQKQCNKYLKINIDNAFDIEKKIASYTRELDENTIENIYNIIKYNQLDELLKKYLQMLFNDNSILGEIIITNTEFIKNIMKFLKQTPINTIKDYLIWRIFNSSIYLLDSELHNLYNSFYNRILSDKDQDLPRNEYVISLINIKLDDLLGKIYGEKYYTKEIDSKVFEIINNIKNSMITILQESWLTNSTISKAISKIKNMNFKIGFPKEILDYSKLTLYGNFFFQTKLIDLYIFDNSVNNLYKKPNFNLWEMGAHEVNAYYSVNINEFVLPCGILQAPFFDITQSDSYNYARIGTIIGHEICHGFDDEGRKFDNNGNLNIWWNKFEINEYIKRSTQFINQYNKKSVNGKLTLGENIADLYGVRSALNALLKTPNPDLDIFYKSYAGLWRQKMNENEKIKRLLMDVHAPGKNRVNTILSNVDEFILFYNINENDGMYLSKEDRFKLY